MYQAHIQEASIYREGFLTIMFETYPLEGTFAIGGGRRDSVRMEQDAPRWSLTTGGLSQQMPSEGASTVRHFREHLPRGEKKKDLKNVS